MRPRPFLRAAARNNAEWCDAFCRTHGVAGHFGAACWTSPVRTPPFYPDAVSLSPGIDPAQVLAQIDAGDGCSVKDSFADLDLAADGFRTLFRAEWLLREPGDARRTASGRSVVVETRGQLQEWESTWGASPTGLPFFQPALLANTTIAVLARYDGDAVVAGAVANRSATVIGISNVFDAGGDLASAWLDAAGAARARWGPMPLVGYASGAALEAAHEAGFSSIGELAVWMNDAGAVVESHAVVSLRPITDANREAVEALAVTPDQRRFVSGVRESILEAAEEPDARALYWAIYAEETPVGFVMIADEVGSPDYIAHYLWKLLIDERYQRRGFGTATLDLIVEYFRDRSVGAMWTSAGEGEGSPVTFYERYGFERTGDLHGDEILLRLEIS